MPRLYVANCTRQNQEIHYRPDFTVEADGRHQVITRFKPALVQTIPAGRQAPLGRDFHADVLHAIVAQLAVYGLTAVTEARSDNRIIPLVFDVDRPIKQAVIEEIMKKNDGILMMQGRTRRQKAAIATNDTVTNLVASQLAQQGTQSEQRKLEVEYEQLDQSEAGEKRIEEGYRVDPHAPPPPKAPRAPGRRKAAARA